MRIAVFASHGGTDMQAIIDGCKSGAIDAEVALIISNNSDSMALERARREKIDHFHLSAKKCGSEDALQDKILSLLEEYRIDMIFLAGYMRKLGTRILDKYHNRVFNIHPALLPKYGGKGMYGIHVHEAVIEAGDPVSGVTIHRVNSQYDSGDIVAQAEVPVLPGDDAETLAARVLEREHLFLVEIISKIAKGEISLG